VIQNRAYVSHSGGVRVTVDATSTFGRNEQVAAVVGSVVAAVPAGLFVQFVDRPVSMERFAWLLGGSGLRTAWIAWTLTCVLFGLLFGVATARTIDSFSNTVIMVSRQSPTAQRVLVPLLRRSALALTAGSMGLAYGNVIGFGVFAYLMPIVFLMNGHVTNWPLADFGVIGGYLLWATLTGAIYGWLLEADWFDPAETAREQNAAAVGAVGGGAVAAALLALLAPSRLAELGGVVGEQSLGMGVFVLLLAALALGLGFAWLLSATINDFVSSMMLFSRRSDATRKLLVPLVTRAALTATAGTMGLVFGLVVGIALVVAGVADLVPNFGAAGFVAAVLYGVVTGVGYGLAMETVTIHRSQFLPSEQQRAGLIGGPIAGIVSGLVALFGVGSAPFRGLAAAVGSAGLLAGIGAWLGLSVLLALVFVAYVSRTINDFVSSMMLFSRRSDATRKLLVPLVTRAALTVTAGTMGLVFGLVVGVVFYGVSLTPAFPATGALIVVAWLVYGQLLGTVYGLVLEGITFRLPEPDVPEEPVPRTGFARWRSRRPFAGGVSLILAGLMIGAIPVRLQTIPATSGVSYSALGIVFAAMVLFCGVFVLVRPQLSTLVGVTGIAMSILSLIGAFGGLVFGMLVGIVGGSLCVAWHEPGVEDVVATDEQFQWTEEGDGQQW